MTCTHNGKRIDLIKLGEECKTFRKAGGWSQWDVARDLGISRELVSGFECGRSKNLNILLWYIDRGFNYGEVVKG